MGAWSNWRTQRYSISGSERTSTDTSVGTTNYCEYDYSDVDDDGMPRQRRFSSMASNNESDNDQLECGENNRITNMLIDNRDYNSESDT